MEPAGWDEDSLYHHSCACELPGEHRIAESKRELERALCYRPEDSRSQVPLAAVYFRTRISLRPTEIWSRLVHPYGDDVTLRVNLGFVLLETRQPEQAPSRLRRALELDPEHARAWGYLGLAQWRRGNLEQARDAFARGGQASMARFTDERVAKGAGCRATCTSSGWAGRAVTEVCTVACATPAGALLLG